MKMTSERWAGFTDEDIERIKTHPSMIKSCPDKICELEGSETASRKRGPMKIKAMPMKSDEEKHSSNVYDMNSINSERKAKEISPAMSKKDSDEDDYRFTENEDHCTCNNYAFEEREGEMTVLEDVTVTDSYHDNEEQSEEMNHSNANLPALELFEMRQKRIEEENARRRALINKAITDKKMRTHAEAIKLAKITQELNRIDSNLSSDVSILRNYIEKASLEFSEAEKRYLKAEKEFVEAKLFLFEKMQRKEMLTEHLCAIIEQNENRKADKLVELMKQLDMEVIVDECETNGLDPILPNLCALNDEPYHSCQTIKPNLSKENSQEKISEHNQKAEYRGKCSDIETAERVPDASSTASTSSLDGT